MTRYDTDYSAWLREQIAHLDAGDFAALDRDHLVEELELMANSALGELGNRLIVLLAHLLRLSIAAQEFPRDLARAGRLWRMMCQTQRLHIAKVLRRNPSLRPLVPAEVTDAYAIARHEAAQGLATTVDVMPSTCPWTPEEVLNADFWPEESDG